jgi:hypothetical protein
MRITAVALLVLAGSAQGCMPKPDIKAACEDSVRENLLNPETAEFHDFEKVDAAAVKAAVMPPLEAKFNFRGGEVAIDGERKQIESAAYLYRMRVRAEGELGNKVTKLAYCRQPVEGVGACFCTLID